MRTARFFVPPDYIALESEAFTIPVGEIYHQVKTVLRLKVNDQISLMAGDGTEVDGRITEITPSRISGVIAGSIVPPPLRPQVTICASLLKADHFELVLQKCTELGATAFIPLLCERTIKKLTATPPRWQKIVQEASEQSGRVTLPLLHKPMTLAQAIGVTDGQQRVLFHETEGTGLPTTHHNDHVAVFIGPEGGFTDHEVTAAKDARASIVNLPGTILRAETAAIVATALVRFRPGGPSAQ